MRCFTPLRVAGLGSATLLALGFVWAASESAPFEITSQTLRESNFVLTVASEMGGVYTLQGGHTVTGPWQDLTNQSGTGGLLEFIDPLTVSQRFYRVLLTLPASLDLIPAEPVLPSEAVSLPDAVAGTPYQQEISVAGSGTGGFTLAVVGDLPAGISASFMANGTPSATLQLVSDGTGLVAGERLAFTVTVNDEGNQTASRDYDIRVVAPPPVIVSSMVQLKAGEAANATLQSTNGTGPIVWSAPAGGLPGGVTLGQGGALSGMPNAAAAEMNETGLFMVQVTAMDSHTDRVTGDPAPRATTNTVSMRVRLSYRLNILASRANGPSFTASCSGCHNTFFAPNIASGSATSVIGVSSQQFGSCPSRTYVVRGNATSSLLYTKVATPNCGQRMPQGGPFLNATQLARLQRWIQELNQTDTD